MGAPSEHTDTPLSQAVTSERTAASRSQGILRPWREPKLGYNASVLAWSDSMAGASVRCLMPMPRGAGNVGLRCYWQLR